MNWYQQDRCQKNDNTWHNITISYQLSWVCLFIQKNYLAMSYIMTYHKRLQLLNLVDSVYLEMTWEPSDASYSSKKKKIKKHIKRGLKNLKGKPTFRKVPSRIPSRLNFCYKYYKLHWPKWNYQAHGECTRKSHHELQPESSLTNKLELLNAFSFSN